MSGQAIGVMQDTPQACGEEHLPGCFNSWLNETFCICGQQRWAGDHGAWISRRVYDSAGPGAVITGYDVYFLPALSTSGEVKPTADG